MAKGLKEKWAKQPADANSTKRKRNLSINGNGRRSTIWTPSPAESEEEQDQNPPKRQRASEMSPKTNGTHKSNGKRSEVNSTSNAVVDPPAHTPAHNPEHPKPSPKQQKESTARPKQNSATKPASQTKSQSKGSRQPPTPSTPSRDIPADTPTKSRRRSSQGVSESSNKLTGFFTESEVATLESFKLSFCSEHGLSGDTFDHMVQHTHRGRSSNFSFDSHAVTKNEFWRAIYETIPDRDRRSMSRFMRRHFQASTQKPHQWSEEQDDELISLHAKYGPKFAFIANLIGRSSDDVVQRWKNKLEHRNTMRRGPWSYDEICSLLNAVQSAYDLMAKAGTDVGRDIYAMDEALIGYGVVSDKMQNCRSRQQCGDKWRKIRRNVLGERANGNPSAVCDPAQEAKAYKQGRKDAKRLPLSSQPKSSEYVDGNDEVGDDDYPEPQSLVKERKSFGTPSQDAIRAFPRNTRAKPASKDVSKPQSDSHSESDAESESDSSDGSDIQPESKPKQEGPEAKSNPEQLTDEEILGDYRKLVNGNKPKGNAGNAQEKPSLERKTSLKDLISKGKPKDNPQPEEASNAPVFTAAQGQDTASQKRDPSPARSASSTSESDEESEDGSEEGSGEESVAESEASIPESDVPVPGPETTPKPTADRKEVPDSNDERNNDDTSDNSSNESSSEESESEEEDEGTPNIKEEPKSTPTPTLTPSNQDPQSSTIKRKPVLEPKENARPSLKRMKLEMTQNDNKLAEQSTPKIKQPESESESESDNESGSSEDEESGSESESESGSSEQETK